MEDLGIPQGMLAMAQAHKQTNTNTDIAVYRLHRPMAACTAAVSREVLREVPQVDFSRELMKYVLPALKIAVLQDVMTDLSVCFGVCLLIF